VALGIGAQGLVTWAKNAKTYLTYDITHKKKSKTFQLKKIQTRGLAASFEGLNSSLAQSAGKLRWCKVTVKGGSHASQKVDLHPAPKVLIYCEHMTKV